MVSLRRLSDIVDDSEAGDAEVARYLGASAAQALQLTEMADKVSRILGATLSFGNVVPMTEESVERIDTRDDEQIRRTALARAMLQHPGTE